MHFGYLTVEAYFVQKLYVNNILTCSKKMNYLVLKFV